jgi:hypothetical protein
MPKERMRDSGMNFRFIEVLVPRLKQSNEFKNDRAYVDYVYESIQEARKINMGTGRVMGGITPTSHKVSPTFRIREIYESTKASKLTDKQIEEIMAHAVNIKKVQNSFNQRGTRADKYNFYLCWSMYEAGYSWTEIYELSDENEAWDSFDQKTVVRKLQRMAKRFNWQRKRVR